MTSLTSSDDRCLRNVYLYYFGEVGSTGCVGTRDV